MEIIKKLASNYDIRDLFKSIKIEDCMANSPPTVSINDDLGEVEKIFITQRASHVCVVDVDKKIVGMISQKYLYKARSPRKILPGEIVEYNNHVIIDGDSCYDRETLNGYLIKDIMDGIVSTLQPQESLAKAIHEMARMNIGCIPIVNERSHVCGLLKESHIVKLLDGILFF